MERDKFIKFSAFKKYVDGKEVFTPRESTIDLSRAHIGSVWTVDLRKNRKGKIELYDATFVENIDDDEGL